MALTHNNNPLQTNIKNHRVIAGPRSYRELVLLRVLQGGVTKINNRPRPKRNRLVKNNFKTCYPPANRKIVVPYSERKLFVGFVSAARTV